MVLLHKSERLRQFVADFYFSVTNKDGTKSVKLTICMP